MKRILLCALMLATPLLTEAQARPNRAANRYGQPIVNQQGQWQPANAELLARFCDRLDTIPEYLVPYTYVPDKIQPSDFENYRTEDVIYKTYPGYELKLGIDMPKVRTTESTPIVIIIHGGGWRAGSFDAANFVRQGRFLAGKGITAVRVGYTLAGQGNIANTIADLRDAIGYITENAAKYNIDPSRIGFTGISAGGHLSSYMAMTWPGAKALVSHCGPQDLYRIFGDRAARTLVDGIKGVTEQLRYFLLDDGNTDGLIRYSPVNNIPEAGKIPPVMLMHGDFDLVVPFDHTTQLADSLRAKGAPTLNVRVAQYGSHGFLNPNRALYEDDMLAILAFLQRYL